MVAVVQEQKGQRGSSKREGSRVVNMDGDSVGLSNSTNKSNRMEWQPVMVRSPCLSVESFLGFLRGAIPRKEIDLTS